MLRINVRLAQKAVSLYRKSATTLYPCYNGGNCMVPKWDWVSSFQPLTLLLERHVSVCSQMMGLQLTLTMRPHPEQRALLR